MLSMARPQYLDCQSGRSNWTSLTGRTVWTDSPNTLDIISIFGLIFDYPLIGIKECKYLRSRSLYFLRLYVEEGALDAFN